MEQLFKILLLAFVLLLPQAAWTQEKAESVPVEKKVPAKAGEYEKDGAQKNGAEKEAGPREPREFSCEYYRVQLPDGWKAVMPPTEKHGNINAIFSNDAGSCVVTLIMGPTLGADAKTIAGMFADQFKAAKAPAQKNGVYSFSFKQHTGVTQAELTVEGNVFRLVTVAGNQKTARNFLKNRVTLVAVKKDAPETVPVATAANAAPDEAAGGEEQNRKTASPPVREGEDNAKAPDETEKKPESAEKPEDNLAAKSSREQPAKDAGAEPEKSGEYSCRYYTVTLPEGWKAVMPPTDEQGNTNAIFASATGSAVVTMIVGPNLGADAKTIAAMFADQFRAPKTPEENNGQYVFSFPQNGVNARAIVSTQGSEFMLTTIAGSKKEADSFLSQNIKSADFAEMMPK